MTRTISMLAMVALGVALTAPAWAQDPLAQLPSDAIAVLSPGANPVLLLNETDHGVASVRALKIGDEYAAGWKLTGLTERAAVLTNGAASRNVALTGQRPGAPTSTPVPVLAVKPAGPVIIPPARRTVANSSNPSKPTQTREMQAAIATGDIKQIMALDGSPVDFLAANAARSKGEVNIYDAPYTDWSSAHFVRRGTRLAVAVNVANKTGQRQASVLEYAPAEFNQPGGYTPNWPVEQYDAPPLTLPPASGAAINVVSSNGGATAGGR